ncbi:DUF6457 domain-containing protein [Agromyces aerolatus]|uniref:DUF6457 domain-containing protein n=1 Tax=Agromyces sp. LY-1074 TaxID=3074080 RepID=UPI0028595C27|nr:MULTISPECIES: DUF6457 domain-containing protein [unclassified Agromyces]MDR5698785.1 DUF6457 domain-containing protein [Agromyces sp. LY-1074]MDR5705437.1 DUF6457 domain-containing protein [Agromyces sp. LY-1358]
MTEHLPPEAALEHWVAALCERFEVDPGEVPIALILDLAKDAAHGVARPAAPLTTFVAGLIAGRSGGPSGETTRAAFDEMRELASAWSA